jgi:3-oxoacid CoA-transferase subunit B
MEHTAKNKDGSEELKLVQKCSLPLTGIGVVDLIITDLGVIEVTSAGLRMLELAPGVAFETLQAKTGCAIANFACLD